MSLKVRYAVFVFATGLFVSSAGCQMFPHDLQPHRLWRLNRMSAPSRDTYFSVSDPIPEIEVTLDDTISAATTPAVTANEIAPDDRE